MSLKLSIQIALHNRAAYIGSAIRSALDFPFPEAEILIFDDASSDTSPQTVKAFAEKYPDRIRYIRSDENIGCAAARAAMLKETAAEYILVLDDDDLLLPFDIESVLKHMDAHPCCAVSYGKIFFTDMALNPLNSVMGAPFSRFILPFNNPVPHPGTVMRRSAILETGSYMQTGNGIKSVAEDLFLWFRLAARYDFYYSHEFRIAYRQHDAQTTQLKADDYKKAANFIHRQMLDLNKGLYSSLSSGDRIDIGSDEKRAAILVLGIMARYCGDDLSKKICILNAASLLTHDDYGVYFVRFGYFFAKKSYAEALAEAEKVLPLCSQDPWTMKEALGCISKVCKATGNDNSEIQNEINNLNAAYCRFDAKILSKYSAGYGLLS